MHTQKTHIFGFNLKKIIFFFLIFIIYPVVGLLLLLFFWFIQSRVDSVCVCVIDVWMYGKCMILLVVDTAYFSVFFMSALLIKTNFFFLLNLMAYGQI
jgi:hypothetical protein